ncbi:hypothetical protein GF360_02315 [candidate division WWE3 bacterium]|nr:hypothetical protein [candidate division WWE3 bacterium]
MGFSLSGAIRERRAAQEQRAREEELKRIAAAGGFSKDEAQKRLDALPEEEARGYVPTGDIEKQQKKDRQERSDPLYN